MKELEYKMIKKTVLLEAKVNEGQFDVVKKWCKYVALLGVFLSLVFFITTDTHHFYYSYLFSFSVFTTISLGAMFFVLIQFLSRAGWSVVVRRIPEYLMSNIGIMCVLFIPIIFGIHDLYHWSHADALMSDRILQGKAPYLNTVFFIVRAVFFFAVWLWISKLFSGKSELQDYDSNIEHTALLQRCSPVAVILFALTLTFGFIDWVMSLTPHWYSTIFGVYIFAGALVGFLALNSIIYILLVKKGILKKSVTIEHFHDLGKLLYGFNVFWAYIAFSQYFLIWYGNIPEETVWYGHHFSGSWNTVAVLLAIGHFGIPFVLFMSRHAKRHLSFHFGMAIWMLVMHVLDLYWIIMPTVSPSGIHISVTDISTFLAVGGIYFYVFIKMISKGYIIPINDPRIEESLKFENY
jgi:hypothetical protein